MIKKLHLIITGHVQDVNFRYESTQLARSLGITGWARNNPDGSFEIVAEGEEADLIEFLEWSKHGPRYANVKNIKINWQESTGEYIGFTVTH